MFDFFSSYLATNFFNFLLFKRKTIGIIFFSLCLQLLFGKATYSSQDTTLLPELTHSLSEEGQIFELPTPDNLAFENVEYSKMNNESSAIRNGQKWKAKFVVIPGFYENLPNSGIISFGVFDSVTNSLIEELNLSILDLYKFGENQGVKNLNTYTKCCNTSFASFHFSAENGCSTYATYLIDATSNSFVRVVAYDPSNKILKLRFRLCFKLKSNDSNFLDHPLTFPEKLIFDDGVLYTANLIEKRF